MARDDTNGVPPAGWWPSPWPASQVARGKVSRGDLQSDGGRVAWVESRPDEGGRQVVVVADPDTGTTRVWTPDGRSVRSRVHEYGGGAATLADGVLFVVDQDDQAWWRLDPDPGVPPLRLAATGPTARHADGRTVAGGRWLLSVEERVDGPSAAHRLVATPTDGSGPARVVVDAGDFVAAPRPSPDGRWLAWCTWDHPDMPWDAARLCLAPLTVGRDGPSVGPTRVLAGGDGASVGQPRWGVDGALYVVDDASGWWRPHRWAPGAVDGTGAPRSPVALVDRDAEFHGPDWVFGQRTFAVLADGSLVARMGAAGRDHLVVLRPPPAGPDAAGWTVEEVDQPCVQLTGVVSPDGRDAVVLGTTPSEAAVVLHVTLDGSRPPRRLSAPPATPVPAAWVSPGRPRLATSGTHEVPGLFFPPTNPDVDPDPGWRPPLVVFCHGGPTAAAQPGWDPVVQFLTSRGIAVAAVDYRGSTGYGRAWRDALAGGWGEADVDDCVAYAEALAGAGLVDGGRMAIRGTSVGGLTALAALVRSRVFAGAVAWYGVTDLTALADDTHDFESWYLDRLVGPLPEAATRYRARSPLHHAAELSGRVLLLQGADDPIVPLDQAERFAAELRSSGADCDLRVFPGESHGFRSAATIEAALEAELGFYRTLFAPTGPDGA